MELQNAIVKVVMDGGRARVKPEGFDSVGFVRFPNNLRKVGARYRVESLVEAKAGSWIVRGFIAKM